MDLGIREFYHCVLALFRLSAILGVIANSMCAQYLTVAPEMEPGSGAPKTEPLPRVRTSLGPLTSFRLLTSSSKEDQLTGLHSLGVMVSDPPDISNVSLTAAHLENDRDFQYLLKYSAGSVVTKCIVFSQRDGNWWKIGEFSYGWHWNEETAANFISLRELVWPGRKEVVVRDVWGGTDVVVDDFSIYRMREGILYRVFQAELRDGEQIQFQGVDSTLGPAVIIRRGPGAAKARDHILAGRRRCEVFGWQYSTFSFVSDAAATSLECGKRF